MLIMPLPILVNDPSRLGLNRDTLFTGNVWHASLASLSTVQSRVSGMHSRLSGVHSHSYSVDQASPLGPWVCLYAATLHPPLSCSIIQPEMQYIFYPTTEDRRLVDPYARADCHCSEDVQRLYIAVTFTINTTARRGFDPRTAHSAAKHVTARPLRPAYSSGTLRNGVGQLVTKLSVRSAL